MMDKLVFKCFTTADSPLNSWMTPATSDSVRLKGSTQIEINQFLLPAFATFIYCKKQTYKENINKFGLYFFEELISQNNPIRNWAWF